MSGDLIRLVQWMSTTWPAPDLCALSEISYGWERDRILRQRPASTDAIPRG